MALKNAVALITGGAQGLGKGFAKVILDAGGKVSLLDVKDDVGLKTENEFKSQFGSKSTLFIKCDVRRRPEVLDAFRKTVDTFGPINLVVNNAGVVTMNQADWERTIDINLTAVMRCSLIAAEFMSSDKPGCHGGHIINISSAAGLTGIPGDPAYCASKHGVVGLSRSLAIILQPKAIRVNCLCPTYTDTQIVADSLKSDVGPSLKSMIDAMGVMPISDVLAAFKQLLNETDKTGSVLLVNPKGLQYRYPGHALQQSKL